MDLIYYRGLNCRLACILNLSALLGVNHLEAFDTLWSETDFSDEAKYNIYASKRVYRNLEALGIRIEPLAPGEAETEESLARIPEGEPFLVGTDTFCIPWHPVFRYFHGPHYMFCQKESERSILCFDPVYGEKNIKIKARDILPSAFELSRVYLYKIDTRPPENKLPQEAGEVLRRHPETREKILGEILKCGGEGRHDLNTLIKQINAMIDNRYLFQRFFDGSGPLADRHKAFFDKAYFLKWEAVRNGLYKASIVKDNKNVVDEVYGLFSGLMQEEIAMAKEILEMGLRP